MSGIIYSTDDTIKLKVDDIEISISPLTFQEKRELSSKLLLGTGGNLDAALEASFLAIKYGVKEVFNLKNSEGKPYKLKFEENKRHLTDTCVEDLLNIKQNNKLVQICSQLLNGINSSLLIDPVTGDNIEGVELLEDDCIEKK